MRKADKNNCKRKKGMAQTDFIIAVGLFMIIFATVIQLTNVYFITLRETTEVGRLRTDAVELLNIADRDFSPSNWTTGPERIGLYSPAYRFYILVNNTNASMINQSNQAEDRAAELVTFNLTLSGIPVDMNSVLILDRDNNTVTHEVAGSNVSFVTAVSENESIFYTVYFDDDSNFTSFAGSVSGTNNITETLYPVETLEVLQYRKFAKLNATNYTNVKSTLDIQSNFKIKIYDSSKNLTFFEFGGNVPRVGNVVALQRFVMYQNLTRHLNPARLTIQTW